MTEIPKTIGNYRIERLLGEGGMADVYLATHMLMNRQFAVKIIKPELCARDPLGTKRFIREAQLAQKVHHPNVVKVFDVGEDPSTGLLYLVMEFVKGVTLADYSRGGKIPSKEIRKIACDMAKALIALDEQGIVHRDIKPSNIMLCSDGTLKLMDLGIAKGINIEKEGETALTMENSVLGTPAFASPEQCRDSKSVDIRADIYCLGASLYAIALGRPPYGGTTAMEVLMKVMDEKPQPLTNVRSDLEPDLVALIEWMMEKSPDKRPQTPRDLLVALVSRKIPTKRWRYVFAGFVALVIVIGLFFGLWKVQEKRKAAARLAEVHEEMRKRQAKEAVKKKCSTLEERFADVQKKLANEVKASKYDNRYVSLRINDYANNIDFVIQHFDAFKVLVHQAQYYRIEEQIKRRDLALNLDKSKFDAEATAKFQEAFNKSTRSGDNFNFNDAQVLKALKGGKIDPNVEVVSLENYKSMVPLLYYILPKQEQWGYSGNRNHNELILELLKLGVNTNNIFKVQSYKKLEMNDIYLTVLTTGGVDKLEHHLLPVMKGSSKPFARDLILLNHDVHEKDDHGNTALHYAAQYGMFDVAALLLASGADINARNNSNESPLFVAARAGQATVEKLLLTLGADTTLQNKEGKTFDFYRELGLFQKAALACDVEKLRGYLEKGFSPNTVLVENKRTLLEHACAMDNFKMAELLLKHKADTELHSANTSTPFASVNFDRPLKDNKIFTLLLEHGANPNTDIPHKRGFILDVLIDSQNKNKIDYIKELLDKSNAAIGEDDSYCRIFEPENKAILPLILEHIKEFKNDIPILVVALAGDAPDEIIKILIEKKANVNCVFSGRDHNFPRKYAEVFLKGGRTFEEFSRTALYIAVERRRLGAVKLLLEHGAQKDWNSKNGKNILHLETSDEIKELLK